MHSFSTWRFASSLFFWLLAVILRSAQTRSARLSRKDRLLTPQMKIIMMDFSVGREM